MNPAAIQFIYFDLDDTLLDHRRAERAGLKDVYEAHAPEFASVSIEQVQATYHQHSVVLWSQYAHGHLAKADLKRLRFAHTLQSLGIDGLDAEALNAYYLKCYARHWTLSPTAEAAFHALADHFPVGILTNGFAEVQHAKFARFPRLTARAEALVISEETGYMKPHPQIFAHAAECARVLPETILYIGDSYTSDVKGGTGAGWQVAWYTDRSDPIEEPVFRFRQWEDLLAQVLG